MKAPTPQVSAKQGYVSEATVKEIAANAGFEFEAASEINANPKDTKDHPEGVWTLPPGYALGDVDKEKYAAIGESDRMTLRFRKPAKYPVAMLAKLRYGLQGAIVILVVSVSTVVLTTVIFICRYSN